ncbi:hypothetical protein [Asanoa iriomotensis]|uniref:SPW repeat-containing protein n=1 Tax=Asanoa iriomotensis TaxID=234613 RepID=A0ABQ4C3S5_9ACTN|nr:hypothetical protein [Asanoa iriomotensis]GIF57424.1 hypothetical protein Air01nite_35190 [Asanoa iriomotensis]
MSDDEPAGARHRRERRWAYLPYRILISVAAVLVFLQPVLAGQFLSGTFGSLQRHQNVAALVDMVLIVAAPAAVLIKWPGGGPIWPSIATAAMLGVTALQNWAGFNRILGLHVPLGVTIVVLVLALAIWAWRPQAGRRR